jgi:hypothetical protein
MHSELEKLCQKRLLEELAQNLLRCSGTVSIGMAEHNNGFVTAR